MTQFVHLRYLGVMLLIVATASPVAAFKRTFKGDPLKDFEFADIAGEAHQLSQILGERATVAIFWASWSPRL